MLKAIVTTYRGSVAFLVACPLLALIPTVFEMLQHVVEVKIGMYDSLAMAKATEHHPLRMAFGMVKVLSLVIPAYWITRFLAFGDPVRARAIEPVAIRLFCGVIAFHTAMAAIQLFMLPQSATAMLIAFAIGQVVACLIPAWSVAAALGNPDIGLRRSVRIMAPRLPWTFVLLLAALLPLMIPHYALGAVAIMAPKAWLWPALILDSLLVGWLCAIMVASAYVAAGHGAAAHRVDLATNAPKATDYNVY